MRINNKWIWFLNKKLKFATVFFHIISSYPSICYCLFGSRCQQSNPRCHCYPFPNHQPPPALLRGHQGFPMQGKRNNLAGSVPGCLSDMPKPPQLAHFNAEEQQLYAKPPSEWLSSSPISKDEPRHLSKEAHFCCLYLRCYSSSHYPQFIAICEVR